MDKPKYQESTKKYQNINLEPCKYSKVRIVRGNEKYDKKRKFGINIKWCNGKVLGVLFTGQKLDQRFDICTH